MSNETMSAGAAPEPAPISLREIGREIERHLNLVTENDVHWVAVIGEDSVQRNPTKAWTQTHADSILQVAVSQGHSEGHLLYVQSMANRYEPSQVESLFRIKLLCGRNQAFLAARDLDKFLQSGDFQTLVEGRAAKLQAGETPKPVEDLTASKPNPYGGALLAHQFMTELLDSVETLSGIADEHGVRTLADLFYLHSAITCAGFIDCYPNSDGSAVLEVVDKLPSRDKWREFMAIQYMADPFRAADPDAQGAERMRA